MRHHSAEVERGTRRPGGPLTLVLATVLTAITVAQPGRTQGPVPFVAPPTVKPAIDDKKPDKVEPKKEVRPPGKKIAFSMDSKPWSGVFKWVAEHTGLPVIGVLKPPGTFSFTSPPGATYDVEEVIDIINEAMLAQKYYLL